MSEFAGEQHYSLSKAYAVLNAVLGLLVQVPNLGTTLIWILSIKVSKTLAIL